MDVETYVDGFHDPARVKLMTYKKLGNTGLRVSHVSIGGCSAGGIYGPGEERASVDMYADAIRSGINYIDTAPFYGEGKSEEVIGKALKHIPRKAYYIGTKVGRYSFTGLKRFDFSYDKTLQSVDKSLQLLGLDYVDVIQVHDLEFAEDLNQVLTETLPALQKVVSEGKARYIGITGYPLSVLREVVERSTVKIDTVLSYARNTLIDQELSAYIPFFKEHGIGVLCGSLTAMRMLTPCEVMPWHPAGAVIRQAAEKAKQHCNDAGVDIARLAVQKSVSTKGVASCILGCDDVTVLRKNLDAATIPPTTAEAKVAQEIRTRYFAPLTRTHWEGVEIERYKQEMRECRQKLPTA